MVVNEQIPDRILKLIKFIVSRAMLLVCSLLMLSACQQPVNLQTVSLNDAVLQKSRIIVMENGMRLTPDVLADRLSQAPLLIIGEEHTNRDHHIIEQWLLERLVQQRPQGSVLMEMLSIDQQPLVNEVKRAMAANSYLREPRIQELLRWNTGWPWTLYRGLVLSVLQGNYPLIAANLDQAQVHDIFQTARFPSGEQAASKTARDVLSSLILTMHNGAMTPRQLTAMLAIQQSRDRFMAMQLLHAPRPTLLFAGGAHAAKNMGVPLHIQDLRGDKPLVLMLATDDSTLTAGQADYVWYTPMHAP